MTIKPELPSSDRHDKYYGLDHLRALAIILVFFYHYQMSAHPKWVTDLSRFGWTGVDLFFVLSGFLIASQLFAQVKKGDPVDVRDFYLKRFFRIIPAYLVVVALYFSFPAFHERSSLPSVWRFLTFTQNFGLDISASGTFSHAWSLCVEEHFYLVLPLILVMLQVTNLFTKGYWLIAGIFISGILIRYYSWNRYYYPGINQPNEWVTWYKFLYYPTYNRLDGLLTGVSIAAVNQFLPGVWARCSKFGNPMLITSLFILAGAYYLFEDEHSFYATVYGFPLVSLGYGLMVMGALSPSCLLFRWHSRATTTLATLSYAIYLTHKGIVHLLHMLVSNHSVDPDGNLMLLICIAGSLTGAIILNFTIEKPFLRLRKMLVKENP